ncbi:hypothetical protein OXYTRIMIC_067 [Oxytricha trifallax]|uniref:Uncharacterized protein n=1 Tax=Oxytricha trifallax TaxID=1172189 RepID=A0A073HYV1_9SPIT|nr:hypothetical protein OXYTRIMIC_067 [Oxytricha trifallax]
MEQFTTGEGYSILSMENELHFSIFLFLFQLNSQFSDSTETTLEECKNQLGDIKKSLKIPAEIMINKSKDSTSYHTTPSNDYFRREMLWLSIDNRKNIKRYTQLQVAQRLKEIEDDLTVKNQKLTAAIAERTLKTKALLSIIADQAAALKFQALKI